MFIRLRLDDRVFEFYSDAFGHCFEVATEEGGMRSMGIYFTTRHQ